MRKNFWLILFTIFLLSVAACTPISTDTPTENPTEALIETYELALITDFGTIDDKSFNQGSWEGLKRYAEENNITHKYYQPAAQSDEAYFDSIELAVKNGAKVIVTPGFLFANPVGRAQSVYPDVYFIIVDSEPTGGALSNTVSIGYADQQSGFLAGYAAVKEGFGKLGFIGGLAVPAVVNFGYGYVQGAEYAAGELGLDEGAVTIYYHYTGSFKTTPEAQILASSWYNNGVEVIFACGGAVGSSVMAAAEAAGKFVIGVDVDQSGVSDTVITSAMKGLEASVYSCVKDCYDGNFPGGRHLIFNAANDGVALSMDTSKFVNFTQADYDAIYTKLKSNSIPFVDVSGSFNDMALTRTNVTEVK